MVTRRVMDHFRAGLATACALALLTAPLEAEAQQAGKLASVATLWTTNREVAQPDLETVDDGLRELGWVAGRNLILENWFTDGKPESLAGLAAELLAWKPDLAVGPLNPAALQLKRWAASPRMVVLLRCRRRRSLAVDS